MTLGRVFNMAIACLQVGGKEEGAKKREESCLEGHEDRKRPKGRMLWPRVARERNTARAGL
jgi:hypothetical protein